VENLLFPQVFAQGLWKTFVLGFLGNFPQRRKVRKEKFKVAIAQITPDFHFPLYVVHF